MEKGEIYINEHLDGR